MSTPRQIVSVVTEQGVAYYVHDGERAEQIAQLVNPGLDVSTVVELGVNLSAALMPNNGDTTKRRAPKALPPAPKSEAKTKSKPKSSARSEAQRQRVSWGFTRAAVLDDIRAHPATTTREIAARLLGVDVPPDKAISAINGHIALLRDVDKRRIDVDKESVKRNGVGVQINRYTFVER